MVPFLVLLPLIENGDLMEPGQSTMSLLAALGPTALQARACTLQLPQRVCLQGLQSAPLAVLWIRRICLQSPVAYMSTPGQWT